MFLESTAIFDTGYLTFVLGFTTVKSVALRAFVSPATSTVRYNGKVYTSNFVISDNQGKASVTFTPEYSSSNVLQFGSSATVKQALEKAIQEVDYNGYKINSSALASNIVKVEGTINNVPGKVNVDITNDTIARQNNFTVTKLVVKVKVPDTNVYTDVEVDLPNTVITIQ